MAKKADNDLKEWTIMIYMAGDNNLSVDMAYAMEQIKEVAGKTPESPNIFVYYDGNSPQIPTLYCDFSNPVHPVYASSYKAPKLEAVPEKYNENAANWRSILNFVNWCVNEVEVRDDDGTVTKGRRANRYALIFSGHSLGFQDIGLFKDESSGKTMKMVDLYFTLERMVENKSQLTKRIADLELSPEDRKKHTTVLLGQKLDILGFDSCVMGMLEVGYQFGGVAKTMIASEGSVPNAGWTYAKLLGSLACGNGDKKTSNKVAERFVREFIKGQDSYTVGGVSVDMAAWDLDQLNDLATAFDELGQLLIECFREDDALARQMERIILHVHWKCQSYMYEQNVDLGDFCELLDEECGRVIEELGWQEDPGFVQSIRDQCQKVLEELRKAVIVSGFSGGAYQYSNGISVFFPWSRAGYEASRKNYEELFFQKDTKNQRLYWNGFLRKYLREVSLRRFVEPNADALPGEKYRYRSGVQFDKNIGQNAIAAAASAVAGKLAGQEASKLAGHEASKLAGHEASKLAGHEASKLAGHEASKLAGQEASKLAGQEASKLAGHEASKLAGQEASKLAGHEASKLAGQEASKLAGHEASKLAGHEASKLAGQEASKLAGQEASKLAGHEASKLAGGSGGSAFFENLRLFKNVESRWNISGFTKKEESKVDY